MPTPIPGPPPFATATTPGLVSTGTQSFGGDKTFNGIVSTQNPLGLAQYATGSLPSATSHAGRIVYDSTLGRVKFSNGIVWVTLDSTSGSFVQTTGDTMTGQLNIVGAGLVVDTADNTLFVNATANNVIVGSNSSTYKFDVVNSSDHRVSAFRGPRLGQGARLELNTTGGTPRTWYQTLTGDSHSEGENKLIFSHFASPTETPILTLTSTGNVGVGVTSPASKFSVAGDIRMTSGGTLIFPDGTVQTSAFSSSILKIDSINNRVGINSPTPTHTLDVRSNEAAHAAHVQNTNTSGSSSLLFRDSSSNDRMRIGTANSGFSAFPGLNFIQTDAATDLVVAHGSTAYHRFYGTGVVKFDDADNTLVVDSANNRVGVGVVPSSGFSLDVRAALGTNQSVLKIRNTDATGYSGIAFYSNSDSPMANLGYGNSATGGGSNSFSLDSTAGMVFRSGTTNASFISSVSNGVTTFDIASNLLSLDYSQNTATINGTTPGTVNGYTLPLLVNTASAQALGIRGIGSANKVLLLNDSTNNRSWAVHHRIATENNRMEFWYHDGTTDNRKFIWTTDGRLGINNTIPTVELDVTGSAQFSGGLTVDTNTLVVNATDNSVGVGGSAASGIKLDVFGKGQFSDILGLAKIPTGSLPAPGAGNEGFIVYDDTTSTVKFSDGSTWSALSGGGGGGGYTTIQEEGSGLTARATLNFIGAGITAVDNGGASKTDITVHTASTTQEGTVSTGAQTFEGLKNFSGGARVAKNQSADTVFEVENTQVIGSTLTHAMVRASDGTNSVQLMNWPSLHASGASLLADSGGLYCDKPNGFAFESLAGDFKFIKKSGITWTVLGKMVYSNGLFDWSGKASFGDIVGLPKIATGSLPTPGAGNEGYLAYDDTTNVLKFSDGSSWVTVSTGSGSGYATVQEEGSSLTQRATLNFIGGGVTATDNGGASKTEITVHTASATQEGTISTGAQTLAGVKTFNDAPAMAAGLDVVGQKFRTGSAAPASGTWAVGDIVFNTTPVAGGSIGWVCVTAGTPGTWKEWGPISA